MNKQQEALKLALEALEETLRTLDDENAKPGGAISDTIWYSAHETLFDYLGAQIATIREALAEQRSGIKQVIELYDSPEQPAQQQEPVAYSYTSRITGAQGFSHHPMPRFIDSESWDIKPLYTSPPASKPWVGLTEAEMRWLQENTPCIQPNYGFRFIKHIEAKLKEKNT